MDDCPRQACAACGAENELPPAALAYGSFRCHRCGEINPLAAELQPAPAEAPLIHREPVQTEASYTPSRYNTPEALRRAEAEASRVGCLVALLPLCALLASRL